MTQHDFTDITISLLQKQGVGDWRILPWSSCVNAMACRNRPRLREDVSIRR